MRNLLDSLQCAMKCAARAFYLPRCGGDFGDDDQVSTLMTTDVLHLSLLKELSHREIQKSVGFFVRGAHTGCLER